MLFRSKQEENKLAVQLDNENTMDNAPTSPSDGDPEVREKCNHSLDGTTSFHDDEDHCAKSELGPHPATPLPVQIDSVATEGPSDDETWPSSSDDGTATFD